MENSKTQEQFLKEIEELTVRISELEKSEIRSKIAEKKILEYNTRYLALFMSNAVATIVVDVDCKIIAFNNAQKNCGYRLPEIGNRMYVDYAGRHNIDMHAELLECISTGEVKKFQNLKYARGESFLSITIAPFDEGAIITSEDITQRVLADNELRKHQSRLEELVKERTIELQEKNKELNNAINVFAGRELTIRELRKIIETLKEKQ